MAVFSEIWTGEMIKSFRTQGQGWYDRIRSYDQYVNNNVIHFTEIGGDPDVLVNNTTYPLNIQELSDTDKAISLDRFDTTATPVTDDELHACSYDRMASVLERHREALREKEISKALHAIAPAEAQVQTAGGSGDYALTFQDILKLKMEMDKKNVPLNDRVLVLSSDAVYGLLETEQKFREHYNINQTEGKITRLYGFDIYESNQLPTTDDAGKKAAFGQKGRYKMTAVAFCPSRVMKAGGTVDFYHSEAKNDPLHHRNLVNFRHWSVCLPLKDDLTFAVWSSYHEA